MSELLWYRVPEECADGVKKGLYKVVGSVVRDSDTGQIVKHLEKSSLDKILDVASKFAGNVSSSGISAVSSIIGNVQSAVINKKLKKMDLKLDDVLSSIENLASKSNAILSLSKFNAGMGIANACISVVGFKLVCDKIDEVNEKIDKLQLSVDNIKKDTQYIKEGYQNQFRAEYDRLISKILWYKDEGNLTVDDLNDKELVDKLRDVIIDSMAFINNILIDEYSKGTFTLQDLLNFCWNFFSLYQFFYNICIYHGKKVDALDIHKIFSKLLSTSEECSVKRTIIRQIEDDFRKNKALLTNDELNKVILNYEIGIYEMRNPIDTQEQLYKQSNDKDSYFKLYNELENKGKYVLQINDEDIET